MADEPVSRMRRPRAARLAHQGQILQEMREEFQVWMLELLGQATGSEVFEQEGEQIRIEYFEKAIGGYKTTQQIEEEIEEEGVEKRATAENVKPKEIEERAAETVTEQHVLKKLTAK